MHSAHRKAEESDSYRVFGDAPTLRWAVKSTFCRYVVNAGGEVTPIEPWSLLDGQFVAPVTLAKAEQGSVVTAAGGVSFVAHNGHLRVGLEGFSLELTTGQATLSVRDPDQDEAQMVIARGSVLQRPRELIVDLHLTFFGCRLFGDVYQPGDPLDAITLSGIDA